MIYIQELNWNNPDEINNLDKFNNPIAKELIARQKEIFSDNDDINFRIAEESTTKLNLSKLSKKQFHNNYNDYINAIIPKINFNNNCMAQSCIQQYQLNLYKQNKESLTILSSKCYINNKLQYLKIDNTKSNIKQLDDHNISYIIHNNNLFIDYNYYNIHYSFINISKNIIYFLDNQLYILTSILYTKANNAILIQLKNQVYHEKFNIYRWNNFEEPINKFNQLLIKFNFDINIALDNAIINHYNNH